LPNTIGNDRKTGGHKSVVVLDAGIATDDNLKLITKKGTNFFV
jgi:hypothetical protein